MKNILIYLAGSIISCLIVTQVIQCRDIYKLRATVKDHEDSISLILTNVAGSLDRIMLVHEKRINENRETLAKTMDLTALALEKTGQALMDMRHRIDQREQSNIGIVSNAYYLWKTEGIIKDTNVLTQLGIDYSKW